MTVQPPNGGDQAVTAENSHPVDSGAGFKGDRYERVRKAAEVLASDDNLASAKPPYNAEGLLAFVDSMAQLRLLDGLSEYDCNTIGLICTLDFLQGPRRMAWRIWDMLADEPQTPTRNHDNEIAVIHAMAGILRMVVGAWLEPDPIRNLTALYADVEEAANVVKYVAGDADGTEPFREAAADLLTARDAVADAIEALH